MTERSNSNLIEPTDNHKMPDLGCRDWIGRLYNKVPICVIYANVIGVNAEEVSKQPICLPCDFGRRRCVISGIPEFLKSKYNVQEEPQEDKDRRLRSTIINTIILNELRKK